MIPDGNLLPYKGIKGTGIGNYLDNYTRLILYCLHIIKDNCFFYLKH